MNEHVLKFTAPQSACLSAAVAFSFLYAIQAAPSAVPVAVICAASVSALSGLCRSGKTFSNIAGGALSLISLFPFALICRRLAQSMAQHAGAPTEAAFLACGALAIFLASPAVNAGRACALMFIPTAAVFFVSLIRGGAISDSGGGFYTGAYILSLSGAFSFISRRAECGEKAPRSFRIAITSVGAALGGAAYAAIRLLGARFDIMSLLSIWTFLAFGAAGAALPVFELIVPKKRGGGAPCADGRARVDR